MTIVENIRSFYPYSKRAFDDANNKKLDELQEKLKIETNIDKRSELQLEIRKIYDQYKPKYDQTYYMQALDEIGEYRMDKTAADDLDCIDIYKFYSNITQWVHCNCLEEALDYIIANFSILDGPIR